MNTITAKLAAVLVALMVNGLILGGIAFLFDGSGAPDSTVTAKVTDTPHHVV